MNVLDVVNLIEKRTGHRANVLTLFPNVEIKVFREDATRGNPVSSVAAIVRFVTSTSFIDADTKVFASVENIVTGEVTDYIPIDDAIVYLRLALATSR